MADVKHDDDRPRRRKYDSSKRDEAARNTRRRIRAAAESLFLRDGYVPTTMVKIASEARVAEKTVYLAYPSKAALLNEIIRVGVRGDDADPPLAHRDTWVAILRSESTSQLLERFATGGAQVMARAAAVLRLGEACATSDPQLAELRDRGHAHIRADMREIATELARRGALSSSISVERATDILFAFISNESPYLRLVEECNWTPQEYAELTATLISTLLRAPLDDAD
jgi:TetR/AcrR family transcriptional regulator, regulator of autoinduction and epiphytic fitness